MFLVTIITHFTPSKYSKLGGRYSRSGICGESLVSTVSQTLQSLVVHYLTQSLYQFSYTLLFQSPISTSVTKLNNLFKIIFLIQF